MTKKFHRGKIWRYCQKVEFWGKMTGVWWWKALICGGREWKTGVIVQKYGKMWGKGGVLL